MTKVGIFGGSFDPPHIGHLIAAETVRQKYNLNKIIWIPTSIPPHKQKPVASPKDRVNLVKLAIKNNPYLEMSTLELKSKTGARGATSSPDKRNYTIDTLKKLIARNPSCELFLIIGADEAVEFSKWKAPAEILKLCKLIILGRQGIAKLSNFLPKAFGTKFCPLNIDISSSLIRELVKKGKSIKKLVPAEVEEYIREKKLYT